MTPGASPGDGILENRVVTAEKTLSSVNTHLILEGGSMQNKLQNLILNICSCWCAFSCTLPKFVAVGLDMVLRRPSLLIMNLEPHDWRDSHEVIPACYHTKTCGRSHSDPSIFCWAIASGLAHGRGYISSDKVTLYFNLCTVLVKTIALS